MQLRDVFDLDKAATNGWRMVIFLSLLVKNSFSFEVDIFCSRLFIYIYSDLHGFVNTGLIQCRNKYDGHIGKRSRFGPYFFGKGRVQYWFPFPPNPIY